MTDRASFPAALVAQYAAKTLAEFQLSADQQTAFSGIVDMACEPGGGRHVIFTPQASAGVAMANNVFAVATAMAAPGARVLVVKNSSTGAADARDAIARIHARSELEPDASMHVDVTADGTHRMTVALPGGGGGTSTIFVSPNGLFGIASVMETLKDELDAPTALFIDELLVDVATTTESFFASRLQPQHFVLVVRVPAAALAAAHAAATAPTPIVA